MRVQAALERFLVQLRADGRSPHTLEQYQRHVRMLGTWMADQGLVDDVQLLGHSDLAYFLAAKETQTRPDGKPKKATSLNVLRSSLKSFFGYLHQAGYVDRNPARLIRKARCGPAPPRALSKSEQERLMAALAAGKGQAAERDYALFHTMLATGIRLGSALALKVDDLDLETGELWLRETKGDRPVRVFLGEEIREHLAGYLGGRCEGSLFPASHGGRLVARTVQRRFHEWLVRAGIQRAASPHALRHTFATGLYQRTRDVLLVKEALGHRSVSSTLAYARPASAPSRHHVSCS